MNMYTKRLIYKYANHIHRLCYSGLLLALLLLAALSQPAVVLAMHADTTPGGDVTNPAIAAVDIAKPAVVRIITTIPAHLKVQISPTSQITFPRANPGSYQIDLSGTGTFITSEGDILTADHVINPPKDKTTEQYLDSAAAQDIADYLNQNAQPGTTPTTKDQVLQQLTSGQLQATPTYDTPVSFAFLSTSYTGPLTASNLNNLPANVELPIDKIEKESPSNQQDTAIIHVPAHDTPAVQLDDSTAVNTQDTLTIIGFPGNADVNQQPQDLLTSSINQIYVSSIKTSSSGAPLIQVGGNVEHGDSGGPALDSKGNAVGIVSFALATTQGSGGTSFLQASNSARNLIMSLNLKTAPGKFQTQWNQAFSAYASSTPGHWHQAATDLNQVATAYPQFKAVQPYLNYAQSQAQNETQSGTLSVTPTVKATRSAIPTTHTNTTTSRGITRNPLLSWGIMVIAILVLLALLISLIILTLRKRRTAAARHNQATPTPTHPQPASDRTKDSISAVVPNAPAGPPNTLSLKVWPCGHMNRPGARFCSVCGELALPTKTT